MALRRSVARLAAIRGDVAPHLKMQWKHYYKVDGEIMQHISPYEQKIVEPLFKDVGKKLVRRFKEFFRFGGIPLIAFVWLVGHAKEENEKIHFHHRH